MGKRIESEQDPERSAYDYIIKGKPVSDEVHKATLERVKTLLHRPADNASSDITIGVVEGDVPVKKP
jgi:hypothetical protein